MRSFYKLAASLILGIVLPSSLYGQAETLKFAWPDGASAKVQVRSEGRRVTTDKTYTWDMSSDFTMHLKRTSERIVVSHNDISPWKGTFPPSFGGGAERFVHMVPTLTATAGGVFVGIEGHEAARKLMNHSVEQSGGLSPIERNVFQTMSSNASLEAIATDHWSTLVVLWQDVELNPEVSYEIRNVTPVPQLGGGEINITGAVRFVKETPCESTRSEQRCIHLHAETGADKAQVQKLIQTLLQQAAPNNPIAITAFDRQLKIDIVVEKTTMLPRHLRITRIHSLTVNEKKTGRNDAGAEEYSATYTFTWLLPADDQKKNDPPKSPAPDFSHVSSKEGAVKLASEGKLVKLLLMPAEFGGADIPENTVYVPPDTLEIQAQVIDRGIRLVKEGLNIKLRGRPEYKGNSFVPGKMHYEAWHSDERGRFKQTIEIW